MRCLVHAHEGRTHDHQLDMHIRHTSLYTCCSQSSFLRGPTIRSCWWRASNHRCRRKIPWLSPYGFNALVPGCLHNAEHVLRWNAKCRTRREQILRISCVPSFCGGYVYLYFYDYYSRRVTLKLQEGGTWAAGKGHASVRGMWRLTGGRVAIKSARKGGS